MEITRGNYEMFLIDYLDGKLSPVEVADLLIFLEENLDIKSEFEGVESLLPLNSSIISYPEKASLKKNLNQASCDDKDVEKLLVGNLEGDLTLDEQVQLEQILAQNSQFKKEQKLFEYTKLKPDLDIKFANKQSLKRKSKVIPLYYRYAAAAAVVLFFVTLQYFNNTKLQTELKLDQVSISSGNVNTMPSTANSPDAITQNQVALKLAEKKVNQKQVFNKSVAQGEDLLLLQNAALTEELPIILAKNVPISLKDVSLSTDIAVIDSLTHPVASVTEINPKDDSKPVKDSYLSWKEIASKKIKQLSKDKLKEEQPGNAAGNKLTAWDFASIGARIIEKVGGKTIQLKRSYNEQGELTEYAILGSNFEFSKSR